MFQILLIPSNTGWQLWKRVPFPVRFFKHRDKPLNSKIISLATAFILKFVTSQEWKIIWIPNVSGELVGKISPQHIFSTENSNESNSFSPITFLLIKLNLHTKRLCCCLIWLVWCGLWDTMNEKWDCSLLQFIIFQIEMSAAVLWTETKKPPPTPYCA